MMMGNKINGFVSEEKENILSDMKMSFRKFQNKLTKDITRAKFLKK